MIKHKCPRRPYGTTLNRLLPSMYLTLHKCTRKDYRRSGRSKKTQSSTATLDSPATSDRSITWSKYGNCLEQEKGQYHNPKGSRLSTIQCKGWCDHDRYVWHLFAWRPRASYDLNVSSHSQSFQKLFNERIHFKVLNGSEVIPGKQRHFVQNVSADGIYASWPFSSSQY